MNASHAVTARSVRTVAVVASMLPLSNTVLHSLPCSCRAANTVGRKAQVPATIETGNGRLRWALPPLAPTQTSRSTQRRSPSEDPNGSSVTARSISPFASASIKSGDGAQDSDISTCG